MSDAAPRRRWDWGYAAAVATAAALGAGALLPAVSLVPAVGPPPSFTGDAGVVALLAGRWPTGWGATLETPGQHAGVLAMRDLLVALAGVALGMACATVAALAVSRGAARRRDVAVRAAVGATPWRIAGETLAQVVGFALLTTLAGMCLGLVGLAVLAASRPVMVRQWLGIHAGIAQVLVSAGPAVLALVLLAPVPAIGAATWRLARSLAAGARATAAPGEGALRHGLAVAQLAAALSLLIGAGLLLRGNARTAGVAEDRRSAPADVAIYDAIMEDAPAPASVPRAGAATSLERVLSRVAATPGVSAAGAASGGAWLGEGVDASVLFTCPRCGNGGVLTPVVRVVVRHALVTPGFLALVGAPLARGRDILLGDSAGAPPAAVINRAFERLFQGVSDPIGQTVRVNAGGEWYRIVGVVEDMPVVGPGAGGAPPTAANVVGGGGAAAPALYLPFLRYAAGSATLLVRGGAAAQAVERAIATAGPARVVARGTLLGARERLADAVRWTGGAALAFGAVALLLAVHGVAAVALDEVRRRRRELAVRAALGAPPWRIVALVLRRGFRRVAAGAAWASGGAILVAWLLERLSRELPLFDAAVYAGALVAVALAALVAGVRAALAASTVDPRAALLED